MKAQRPGPRLSPIGQMIVSGTLPRTYSDEDAKKSDALTDEVRRTGKSRAELITGRPLTPEEIAWSQSLEKEILDEHDRMFQGQG